MAKKLWVVLVEDFDYLYPGDRYSNQFFMEEKHTDLITVFTNKSAADNAAQDIASRHPGKDVHVLSQDYGFTCTARPVESKIWTTDGKFIPGTPS